MKKETKKNVIYILEIIQQLAEHKYAFNNISY